MKKLTFVIIVIVVINLQGCIGQNMTALMETCQNDVQIWQDEATKWWRQYVAYVICSCLVWFGGMVLVCCWLKRRSDIDSRKRLGF